MTQIWPEPVDYVKRSVGDTLTFIVKLNPRQKYDVELYTNLNRQKQAFPFAFVDDIYQIELPLLKSGVFFAQVRFKKHQNKRWQWLKDGKQRKITKRVQVDPYWLSQAIVYNVFVRFFKGKVNSEPVENATATQDVHEFTTEALMAKKIGHEASINPGEGGTFDDVKAHLDELKAMKINMLYFNPIHLIGEIYRGYNLLDQLPPYLQPGSPYSIKDYKSIDPELTYDRDSKRHLLSDPKQEFKELIEAAHERGMFIIMDLVFNHTAHDFVLQRIRPEWFLYKEHINSLTDPYLYPDDVKQGKPWGDPKHSMAPYDHDIWWADCAQLNWEYRLPEGPNEPPPNFSLKEMWEYFKSIPQYWIKEFGVDGFRCDVAYKVPPAFWHACINEARETAIQVKTNMSHDVVFIAESYTNDLVILQECGFSAVYGDFSHKLSKPVVLKGYLDYIYNLNGANFPNGSKWFHFPESHDFERSPTKVLGSDVNNPEAAERVNKSRWLLTASLPGIPLIFNGFEKVEWQPINIMSYGAIDWSKQSSLKDYIIKINDFRHRSPALQRGGYEYLPTNQDLNDQTQLMAYRRFYKQDEVLVVVNMDVHQQAGPATVVLPEIYQGKYTITDMLTGQSYEREGRELIVILGPGEGHLFKVEF